MKPICFIGARGGSKGVPRKNIKNIAGKPLIAYSIQSAIKSKLFSHVIVSTEDRKIATVAKKFYETKGVQVEAIKLNGSMELAPSLSMCKRIVDLVSTGKTLKENGLKEIEKIMDVQSKLLINRSAYKTKTNKIESIIESMKKIVK